MSNTLSDLNNYMFEAIERINDDSLSPEELEIELKKADAVKSIGGVIIQNAKLKFDAVKHMDEYGYNTVSQRAALPELLGGGE